MEEYYRRRAQEYEAIYHRDEPERQAELTAIALAIRELFINCSVLEVACGTGYWTQVLALVARHVVAVDAAPEMLEIARSKGLPTGRVDFLLGDAYAPTDVPGKFDAGLANFWFSHVPHARLDGFLGSFHHRLGRGALVMMADNVYIPGVGGELVNPDGGEDTFKLRQLADGSTYQVLKNYYTAEQLQQLLAPRAEDLQITVGSYYWWFSYKVR